MNFSTRRKTTEIKRLNYQRFCEVKSVDAIASIIPTPLYCSSEVPSMKDLAMAVFYRYVSLGTLSFQVATPNTIGTSMGTILLLMQHSGKEGSCCPA